MISHLPTIDFRTSQGKKDDSTEGNLPAEGLHRGSTPSLGIPQREHSQPRDSTEGHWNWT